MIFSVITRTLCRFICQNVSSHGGFFDGYAGMLCWSLCLYAISLNCTHILTPKHMHIYTISLTCNVQKNEKLFVSCASTFWKPCFSLFPLLVASSAQNQSRLMPFFSYHEEFDLICTPDQFLGGLYVQIWMPLIDYVVSGSLCRCKIIIC